MRYTSIETLNELKSGKEIAKKIEERLVDISTLEDIVSKIKLPRKLQNPAILTAILKVVDDEIVLINALERLIAKNKLTDNDLYLFFTNPALSKESFTSYSCYLTDDVIKMINQADPRLEKVLDYIIDNDLEQKEILFNPNLKDEIKFDLIRKHKEKKEWLDAAIELNNLPEDIIDVIFDTFESIPYNSNILKKELKKRHLDKLSTAAIISFLENKKRDEEIVKYAIFLIKDDIQPHLIVEIIEMYPDSIKYFGYENIYDFYKKVIKKRIRAKELIRILEKISNKYSFLGQQTYKSIIKDNGFKDENELFNATKMLSLRYFFQYYCIKDEKILQEVKEKFYSLTNKDIINEFEMYEAIGCYIAQCLELDELFEVMKKNDKKSYTIDSYILSREDFIITEEVMKFLLPKNHIGNYFEKIIIVDNNAYTFTYSKSRLLEMLVKAANENRISKKALDYFKELVLELDDKYAIENKYYLPILKDYHHIKDYYNKIDKFIADDEENNAAKYLIHSFWLQNNTELPEETIKFLIYMDNYYAKREYATHTIYDENNLLIEQKNTPSMILKELIENEYYQEKFLDRRYKIDDDLMKELAYNSYKNHFLERLLSSQLFLKNRYSKETYEFLLALAAIENKRIQVLSYLNNKIKGLK